MAFFGRKFIVPAGTVVASGNNGRANCTLREFNAMTKGLKSSTVGHLERAVDDG
jgi:hypothetical protein